VTTIKNIWVFPDTDTGDKAAGSLNPGLLTQADGIAEKVGGTVTAITFGSEFVDRSETLGHYGIDRYYFFQDPLFQHFSPEACLAAIATQLKNDDPRLLLLGDTVAGRELAARLAVSLDTGLVTGYVKIDLTYPAGPLFYRPVFAGQLYQEIVFAPGLPMVVTLDLAILENRPSSTPTKVETIIIETKVSPEIVRTRHIEYVPADFRQVDISEARTIVGAGAGAVSDDLYPLVKELAVLVEGSVGATRPVIDEGIVPRERLIGQTGKVVSPDFYLALGVSGATHHVGGIQDSREIVAVNRDPLAAIFRSSDTGMTADLKDVLPALINRIKQAKKNGEIL
jgi:electron transfer flavoprotein alpha subunit